MLRFICDFCKKSFKKKDDVRKIMVYNHNTQKVGFRKSYHLCIKCKDDLRKKLESG